MPASRTTKKGTAASSERSTEKKGPVAKVGNLGSAFDLKYGANGTAYARASLAVETPVTPGQWSGERRTDWYEVTIFGDLAEHAAMCLAKGTRVLVIGRAELDHWTGDDGQARTSRKIMGDAIGPDLRWSTCEVTKIGRTTPERDAEPDTDYDEEPF